jgi:RNA polymerase sigma-70 factor (ECF subfamily)
MSSLPADAAALTDDQLLSGLRRGDDAAFRTVVERYHASLVQLAQSFVGEPAVAESVVREAWLDVLGRVSELDDRTSLKILLCGAVIGRARAVLATSDDSANDTLAPAVDPERFRGPDDQYHGGWRAFPPHWPDATDQRLRSREGVAQVRAAVTSLPAAQQRVVILRDVHACTAAEVSDLLEIPEATQRALLHRGRASVREMLASFLIGE